jgi:hypothetical protein
MRPVDKLKAIAPGILSLRNTEVAALIFPFSFALYTFLLQSTGRASLPILTLHGSNDVVCRKDVPFRGRL